MTDKRLISWRKLALRLIGVTAVLIVMASFLAFSQLNLDQVWRLGRWQDAIGLNSPPSEENLTRPTIIGHRGCVLPHITENTIEAMQGAVDAGIDWIEIDIRRTSDELVVFHDATTDAGSLRLKEHTLDELHRHLAHVPTLRQVFEHFAEQDVQYVLDVKDQGIREPLLKLLSIHCRPDQVMIAGGHEVLTEYQGCDYSLGYIAMFGEGWNRFRFLFGHGFILERCRSLGCEYLILPAVFLNQSLIEEAMEGENDLQVWSYRSESEADWNRNVSRGVSGLIVDDPAQATRCFPRREQVPSRQSR